MAELSWYTVWIHGSDWDTVKPTIERLNDSQTAPIELPVHPYPATFEVYEPTGEIKTEGEQRWSAEDLIGAWAKPHGLTGSNNVLHRALASTNTQGLGTETYEDLGWAHIADYAGIRIIVDDYLEPDHWVYFIDESGAVTKASIGGTADDYQAVRAHFFAHGMDAQLQNNQALEFEDDE